MTVSIKNIYLADSGAIKLTTNNGQVIDVAPRILLNSEITYTFPNSTASKEKQMEIAMSAVLNYAVDLVDRISTLERRLDGLINFTKDLVDTALKPAPKPGEFPTAVEPVGEAPAAADVVEGPVIVKVTALKKPE